MARQYIVRPGVVGGVRIGTEGDDLSAYVGKLSEDGPARTVHFGGSKEFVTLIVGKRGSGKSHTLGVILEGLATRADSTSISNHKDRRAVLLLDPMGNFWTTAHNVSKSGTAKVKAQFASLDGWACGPEEIEVAVFLPAGYRTPNDPSLIRDFHVRVCDLDAADLADLLGVNLMKDAQGAALDEAYAAVTEDGWNDNRGHHKPKADYSLADLIAYLDHLKTSQGGGDHAVVTLRALVRSLRRLARSPVFSGSGTPMTDLLTRGRLGILMLPHRVGNDLRRVITRLLIRRILREREEASQIRQRIDIEVLDPAEKSRLEAELTDRPPRSILAIDEAQELLGDAGGEARSALEDFCLLGRNYGLSLLMATQRPTTGAISAKVRSQVDLYIIHRLLTQDDIDICQGNLLAAMPEEVRAGDRNLSFPDLVRSLDPGQAILVPSYATAKDLIGRILVSRVRPRVTVHGGEVG